MTQYEYESICTCIKTGYPAMAISLIEALNNLIQTNQKLTENKKKETIKKEGK